MAMLLACLAVFSLLALTFGKDVPWDYFNYHAYSVELLSSDRLNQDFFAAGLNGYLNPIGFIPLAVTQHWQMDSMSTAVVLASLHSLNAFFLYLICRDGAACKPWPTKVAMALGWVLGVSTPVFLIHLGSTFVDPIGSALVMAATWLAIFRQQPRFMLLAGLLVGVGVAIKLSNIVFALAIAIAIALPRQQETPGQWFARVGSGAVGMLGGFALAQGWWSWHLQQVTDNPFFPLFNQVFQSPNFTTGNTGTLRFVPTSLTDLARLPYRIALPDSWAYLELSAPTVIPLATCSAAIALGTRQLIRFFPRKNYFVAPTTDQRFLVTVAVAAGFWVATSSNGRYGISLFMLLGPTLAILLLRLLAQRYVVLLLALLAAFQTYTIYFLGLDRWNSSRWSPQLLSVEVPEELKRQPQLFLGLSSPSHTEIVPYLHPDSVFVNVRGIYSVPSTGTNGNKLDSLIAQFQNRTQVTFLVSSAIAGLTPDVQGQKKSMNALIDRLGLRLLPDQCKTIRIGHQADLPTHFNKNLSRPIEFRLMSCAAIRTTPNPAFAASRAQAAKIMDGFEAKCPDLFLPKQPQIEGTGQVWTRGYFNHDSFTLVVRFDKDMLFYGLGGQTSYTFIGKASEWRKVVADFKCEVPGKGKRGIDFFNENEKDAIWF